MAYNLKLAERIRVELGKVPVWKRRCPASQETGAKLFDITCKPMKGWLMVAPEGYKTAKQLSVWVFCAHASAKITFIYSDA